MTSRHIGLWPPPLRSRTPTQEPHPWSLPIVLPVALAEHFSVMLLFVPH